MKINYTEIHVKQSFRRALPVVHSRTYSLRANYNGTYACAWDEKTIVVPLEEQALDGVPDALRKIKKPDGVDAMKLETTVHVGEGDDRFSAFFRHEVDMDLHTYIAPDGKVEVPYRCEYGKDVEALMEAAKKQGVKVKIVNAIGAEL